MPVRLLQFGNEKATQIVTKRLYFIPKEFQEVNQPCENTSILVTYHSIFLKREFKWITKSNMRRVNLKTINLDIIERIIYVTLVLMNLDLIQWNCFLTWINSLQVPKAELCPFSFSILILTKTNKIVTIENMYWIWEKPAPSSYCKLPGKQQKSFWKHGKKVPEIHMWTSF